MKKLFLFIAIILLPVAIVALAPPEFYLDYKDVQHSYSHSYANAIKWATEEGIVKGYNDGTFRPDALINRAEFMAVVSRISFRRIEQWRQQNPTMSGGEDGMCMYIMRGCDPDVEQCFPFVDVQIEDWFAGYVCHGYSQDFLDGYPDKTFRPANFINYVEAVKIISEMNQEIDFTPLENDEWYMPYTRYIKDNNAKPATVSFIDQKITRGEMVEIMYRLAQQEEATREITVDLYFTDAEVAYTSDCSAVRSVERRIPHTSQVADATLKLLFKGVLESEKDKGLKDSFTGKSTHEGWSIYLADTYQYVTISEGVATVHFSEEGMWYLNAEACWQGSVKASIETTLKQFPSISEIQYSVDNKIITEWDA